MSESNVVATPEESNGKGEAKYDSSKSIEYEDHGRTMIVVVIYYTSNLYSRLLQCPIELTPVPEVQRHVRPGAVPVGPDIGRCDPPSAGASPQMCRIYHILFHYKLRHRLTFTYKKGMVDSTIPPHDVGDYIHAATAVVGWALLGARATTSVGFTAVDVAVQQLEEDESVGQSVLESYFPDPWSIGPRAVGMRTMVPGWNLQSARYHGSSPILPADLGPWHSYTKLCDAAQPTGSPEECAAAAVGKIPPGAEPLGDPPEEAAEVSGGSTTYVLRGFGVPTAIKIG